MKEFNLKLSDITPVLTNEQEQEILLQVLSIFDGDWCLILTGLSGTFNQKSEPILDLQDRVEKLRRMIGTINNNRVSRWQQEYFKHEALTKTSIKGE